MKYNRNVMIDVFEQLWFLFAVFTLAISLLATNSTGAIAG
jgi:hypothetical protein